jgi:hypothetical protein
MRAHAHILSLTTVTLGSALVLAAPGRAADPIQIAGKDTCKTAEQHAIPVEGDPDHFLVVEKGTCSTSATGQSLRFDGAQTAWMETGDFIKGNGIVHGYLFEKLKDGSTNPGAYTGQITTTMVDGKPHTTWRGTWENTIAKGSYKGEAVSPNEAVNEWEGTLSGGSKQ